MDKYEIINNYDNGEFSDFLQEDNNGLVMSLFDSEGIQILKNYKYANDRIRYILTFSKYCDELFKNSEFVNFFLSTDISSYYASLNKISLESCKIIIEAAINNNVNIREVALLFSYFNEDNKINILNDWPYSKDYIYEIFKVDTESVGMYILEHFNLNFDNYDINLPRLFELGKTMFFRAHKHRLLGYGDTSTLFINDSMLSDKLLNKNWDNLDVFTYRNMINDAAYSTDVERMEKVAEKRENELIYDADEMGLIKPFSDVYNYLSMLLELDNNSLEYNNLVNNLYSIISKSNNKVLNDVFYNYSRTLRESPKAFMDALVEKSNESLSNYIVDYLFKENYYNVMRDIRELLNFYYDGNINLSEERANFYSQISHIDELSYEDKVELFNYGKSFNVVECFYDDMSFARDIVANAIKDSAISKEELNKYLDEELTNKYGVPVYNIKNNSFFGLVKSGNHFIEKYPTGYSFSLVGNGCIGTFDDPSNASTYLYSGNMLDPRQIVHIYPCDSYTLYQPFKYNNNATKRVRTLVMPDELLYETRFYNELLILEKGREKTDMDSRIPLMERIAVYCVNEINEGHVAEAKANGIGIFFVDSSNYNLGLSEEDGNYRHNHLIDDYMNYNYACTSYECFNEKHR